jgi:group I intron endonuclease
MKKKVNFLNNMIFKRNLSRGLPRLKDKPVKFYGNALKYKKEIMQDNKDKSFIYRWTNKINGKTYLGSTANAKKRLNFYFDKGSLLIKNMNIYKALLKYGHDNFSFDIIKYCKPTETIFFEQQYLDKYDFEYNILEKANSLLGFKHTKETLKKFKKRKNFKGKYHSKETRQYLSNLANNKRIVKQLNNNIKLSKFFEWNYINNNNNSNSNSIRLGNVNSKANIKSLKITDIYNNKFIIFNSLSLAALVLCTSIHTIKKYEQNRQLFSYFEWDLLNNSLIERKLLITFQYNT